MYSIRAAVSAAYWVIKASSATTESVAGAGAGTRAGERAMDITRIFAISVARSDIGYLVAILICNLAELGKHQFALINFYMKHVILLRSDF